MGEKNTVEFDILVNGEVVKRVKNGILIERTDANSISYHWGEDSHKMLFGATDGLLTLLYELDLIGAFGEYVKEVRRIRYGETEIHTLRS